MQKIIFLVLCACLCFFLNSCDNPVVDSKKAADWLAACPEVNDSGEPAAFRNAECGTLALPENPVDKQSRNISVNVLRLPAINPAPAADPLFVIAGGPGQSAVELMPLIRGLFEDVRKNRDIVFVDQRGTGKSNPLNCDFDESVLSNLVGEAKRKDAESSLGNCLATFKNIAEFYTTPYAVKDLDAVRAALSYQQINLWGVSYGTRVVLEYLREFPTHVRTATIDGVAPVNIALPLNMPDDAYAALDELDANCRSSDVCSKALGSLRERTEKVAAALSAKSISIQIDHPRTQLPTQVTFDVEDFAGVIRNSLYSRELSSILPYAIYEASEQRFKLLGSMIFLASETSQKTEISMGMHFAVTCAEDFPLSQQGAQKPFLGLDLMQTYRIACAALSAKPMSPNYYEPINSTVPTLLLSGKGDPVTPPRWAESLLSNLPNSKHLVVEGGHHSVSIEGCTAQVIQQFIVAGRVESIDASCMASIKPLSIYLPPGLGVSAQSASSSASKNESDVK